MSHLAPHSLFPQRIAAIVFSIFLSACGGGGGSGTSAVSAAPDASATTTGQQTTGTTTGTTPSTTASASVAINPAALPERVTGESFPTATTRATDPASTPPTTLPAWSITDLTAQIGPNNKPVGMNDAGTIVGVTVDPNGVRARPPVESPFLLKNGQVTALGTLGGSYGGTHDINNAEQVAGYSYINSVGQTHAFLYENGALRDIGALIGAGGSWATGINRAGHVVIYSGDAAYVYSGTSVRAVPDGQFSPVGINDTDQIAGTAMINGLQRAVLHDGSRMINLGTLAGTTSSIGVALNNAGQVVGASYNVGDAGLRGFLYSGGAMREIGPAGASSSATSINDAGDVVGWIEPAPGQGQAFLYRNGALTDLNTLPGIAGSGWTLGSAIKINNAGQIIAIGTLNGQRRYALLTPPA